MGRGTGHGTCDYGDHAPRPGTVPPTVRSVAQSLPGRPARGLIRSHLLFSLFWPPPPAVQPPAAPLIRDGAGGGWPPTPTQFPPTHPNQPATPQRRRFFLRGTLRRRALQTAQALAIFHFRAVARGAEAARFPGRTAALRPNATARGYVATIGWQHSRYGRSTVSPRRIHIFPQSRYVRRQRKRRGPGKDRNLSGP